MLHGTKSKTHNNSMPTFLTLQPAQRQLCTCENEGMFAKHFVSVGESFFSSSRFSILMTKGILPFSLKLPATCSKRIVEQKEGIVETFCVILGFLSLVFCRKKSAVAATHALRTSVGTGKFYLSVTRRIPHLSN